MRLCLLLLAILPGLARAATPTETATFTVSATPTLSPTPGEGSFGVSPSTFVIGSTGNDLTLVYTAGPTAWPSSGGLLSLYFPLGLGSLTDSNFYAKPSDAPKIISITRFPQSAQVQVKDLAPGGTLTLYYGRDAAGFPVSSTQSALSIGFFASPLSTTLTGGMLAPVTLTLHSPTPTPSITLTFTVTETSTISPTHSETPTFSETPTSTISATFTVSPTETPLGEVKPDALYTYPNPFDLGRADKVTLRFPPDPDARVHIFNLAGEPVCELPAPDINGAAGWAVWRGKDDRARQVTGGIYFARVKGAKTFIKRFTVLH